MSCMNEEASCWRAYAAAAFAGLAATTAENEIPVLCHSAAWMADEMAWREGQRAEGEPAP